MRVGQSRWIWGSSLAAVVGLTALCFAPSANAAIERINDGGCEASACNASDCTNPAWTQAVTSAFASSTGPICRSGTGSVDTQCTGGGSIPAGGVTWARLGAGYKGSAMFDGGIIDSLEQTVSIPAGHSATLSFRLRIIDTPGPTGKLTVAAGDPDKIADLPVFAVTDATPGFASYVTVTIDLSNLAGTTPLIRFEGI